MKNLFFVALILYATQGQTQTLASEEVLEELPASSKTIREPVENKRIKKSQPNPLKRMAYDTVMPTQKENSPFGNLPSYARRTSPVEEYDVPTIIPKNADFNNHIEARPGDTLKAVISQNIVAYPGSKSPVTGRILEGKFKGALILGDATMDEFLKLVESKEKKRQREKSTEAAQ